MSKRERENKKDDEGLKRQKMSDELSESIL